MDIGLLIAGEDRPAEDEARFERLDPYIRRAMRVAERIESGICHINGPTVGDEAQMPFGGVKGSGYGRFGGKAAIAEFTDLRWITIEDPAQHYPF